MCGIAGILQLEGGPPPSEGDLRVMTAQLGHRGPDGEGFWRSPEVGLAHTRLSIIDLEGGAQPIHNEDETVWVVFNGEVFNYVELRGELVRRGHRFYTETDTEVIVHLYEDHGEGFVHHLNGQFAIALWDTKARRLVLARDRAGILPLFVTDAGGKLLFASEIKALLPHTGSPRLDPVALDQLMTFWAPVSPRTLFEGVREVPPGHLLVQDPAGRRTRRYWDWTFPTGPDEYRTGPEGRLAEELEDLLIHATQIRLRADVPVGAYLSGGLDSSILTSLVHRHSSAPLQTFSLGFEDPGLDESRYQRIMADHISCLHNRVHCSNARTSELFPEAVRRAETPVLRTAPAPMLLLSRLVREMGYKVVLTGEGSDEVFGGYDLFKEAKVRYFWSRRPESAWRPLLLKRLYPYLDLSSKGGMSFLKDFFGNGLDAPDSPLFAHLPRWETTARAKTFFSSEFRAGLGPNPLEAMSGEIPGAAARWHPFNRGQYVEAKSLLGGYLLSSQGDRMLMANSVEGRFPFLDHRLIEFANTLHPSLKMRVLEEKYLLKRSMADYVPPEIIRRHKQPYRAPDAAAFLPGAGRLAPYAEEMMSPEKIRQSGFFDPQRVGLLVKKVKRGGVTATADNQAFVGILSTQLWYHFFVERFFADFSTRS